MSRSIGRRIWPARTRILAFYRTSHQIRARADLLLNPVLQDVDGNEEDRRRTVSAFSGAPPEVRVLATTEAERQTVGAWLSSRTAGGVLPQEIGVFVRSAEELPRARTAVEAAGLIPVVLDDRVATESGKVAIATMHLAKGLEFRGVVVMACDDEIVPSQRRIEEIGDDADLREVYETERHLLYVACTRARDHLLVTGVAPASEFLADLAG